MATTLAEASPRKGLRRQWIKSTHPIYDAWKDVWMQNERRLRGGDEVLVELRRFDWEKKAVNQDTAYRARQSDATYVNFPDLHASIVAGHMLREAPTIDGGLDFGTLGKVDSEGATPDRARLIYRNVDGAGTDGSHWDQWWMSKLKLAQATGHRWCFVDAAVNRPVTAADEIAGDRPYLVEYSPLSTPNWDLEQGILNWVIFTIRRRNLTVDAQTGNFENKGGYETGYLVLVRAGYDGLPVDPEGIPWAEGGWWKFDKDLELVVSEPFHGTWSSTAGEIPVFPFFFERDEGSLERPAISRPGLSGLGQVAVSYMNLSSAADYDAWDAGQSMQYISGIPRDAHAEVVSQLVDGSKVVGIPLVTGDDGTTHVPTVQDGSTGAVAAGVWDSRLKNKWEEARILAALEATGDPNTSGISKQVSFEHIMSPKLAHVAANLEAAQNQAIHRFEQRFNTGQTPSGSVTWTRTFKLKDFLSDIERFFGIEQLTGYRNPEFGAEMMVRLIEELGLETDPSEREILLEQYTEIAKSVTDAAQKERELLASGGLPGAEGEDTEDEDPNDPDTLPFGGA